MLRFDVTTARDMFSAPMTPATHRTPLWRPAAAPSSALVRSNFDAETSPMVASHGIEWQATTDTMAGGSSQVRLEIAPGADGTRGSLAVRGTINAGAPYPWAGAMLFMADPPMSPVAAQASLKLRFRAGPDWQAHEIVVQEVGGVDLSQLRGIGFAAGQPDGDFELQLDEVELLP